ATALDVAADVVAVVGRAVLLVDVGVGSRVDRLRSGTGATRPGAEGIRLRQLSKVEAHGRGARGREVDLDLQRVELGARIHLGQRDCVGLIGAAARVARDRRAARAVRANQGPRAV